MGRSNLPGSCSPSVFLWTVYEPLSHLSMLPGECQHLREGTVGFIITLPVFSQVSRSCGCSWRLTYNNNGEHLYSTYTTKPFIGIAFLNPLSAQPCEVDTVVMPILQMSTLRPREMKGCDQGHTASKWWSRDLNSGSLAALPPSFVKTHVLHVLSSPACRDIQPVQSVTPLLERGGGSREWITCVEK